MAVQPSINPVRVSGLSMINVKTEVRLTPDLKINLRPCSGPGPDGTGQSVMEELRWIDWQPGPAPGLASAEDYLARRCYLPEVCPDRALIPPAIDNQHLPLTASRPSGQGAKPEGKEVCPGLPLRGPAPMQDPRCHIGSRDAVRGNASSRPSPPPVNRHFPDRSYRRSSSPGTSYRAQGRSRSSFARCRR
jgi:hypothetical protein